MLAMVYCGNQESVEKRIRAIIEREAKRGYQPKGELCYVKKGRVHMGSIMLVPSKDA